MRKKILSIFSFVALFILFGVTIYCIFDSSTVKADKLEKVVDKEEQEEVKKVYVDIKGAINNPGVYEMDSDSRIIDVIKMAGDLTDQADTSILNLSKIVEDEMYIIVYTKDEINEYKEKNISNTAIAKEIEKNIMCPDDKNDACINTNNVSINGKININDASKEELESLTGIGESKAESIIEYRNNNKFESIEDIKNVNGIGDSLYEKIKDNIEV
jgi:competence protein ComEA